MSNRSKLRRRFRGLRRAQPRDLQAANAAAITRHFFVSGLAWRGRRIGAYLSHADGRDGEVDLTLLLDRLHAHRKRIALPVIRRDGVMDFYSYDPNRPLQSNRFEIPEPHRGAAYLPGLSLDLILTPLVTFDDSGVRMGMGGGYYDRYLGSICPTLRPLVVGIAHEVQRSRTPLPHEAWDIKLDGVITEAGWQRFR